MWLRFRYLKKKHLSASPCVCWGEQRLQCLHNADCHFWEVLPPVLLVEKHVACLPLMDVWRLPALFLNQAVHVTISDAFTVQPLITPSY